MIILIIMSTVNLSQVTTLEFSLQSSSKASYRIFFSFIKSASIWGSGTVLWHYLYSEQEVHEPTLTDGTSQANLEEKVWLWTLF